MQHARIKNVYDNRVRTTLNVLRICAAPKLAHACYVILLLIRVPDLSVVLTAYVQAMPATARQTVQPIVARTKKSAKVATIATRLAIQVAHRTAYVQKL